MHFIAGHYIEYIDDIDFSERECVVYGKGDKERKAYFDAKTKIRLLNYIESRTDNGVYDAWITVWLNVLLKRLIYI